MELTRGPQAIKTLAEGHGWEVEIVPGNNPDVEAVALRLRRDDTLLVACWIGGKFAGAYAKPWNGGLVVQYNTPQLRQILQIPADEFEWPADPLYDATPDDVRQIMADEKEYLGTYITRHPLEFVNMARYPDVMAISDFHDQASDLVGERIQLLGLVEEAKVARAARSGNWWAKFSVEDLTGIANGLAFGQTAKRIDEGAVLHLKGKVELRDESPVFIASAVNEVKW